MKLETPANLWKPEYLIDVETMDEQHKHFFQILNVLSKICNETGRDSVKNSHLSSIVWELRRYSQKHFHDEETMLEKHGYHGLVVQCSEHDKFLRHLLGYINDEIKIYELSPNEVVSDLNFELMKDLLQYVSIWWAEHILEKDVLYVEYVKSQRKLKHFR